VKEKDKEEKGDKEGERKRTEGRDKKRKNG